MLVALRSARDMLTKMSYQGFEIKDEKDLLKCLLSVVIDYFGSMFHDKNNQSQDTVFHHLAQGICYTLGDKLVNQNDPGKIDETGNDENLGGEDNCENDRVRERYQSTSSSCVKLLESNSAIDSIDFDELNISFDLTSLSYAYSLLNSSNHVIFLDTRAIYPLSADLPCRYIYYRTSSSKTDDESEAAEDNQQKISSSASSTINKSDDEDRIEIHSFPQVFDDLNSSSLISLPVKKYQLINSSQSLLRNLTIPSSDLINVKIGQQYCLIYLDGDKTILGRSEPFQFVTKLSTNNNQTSKSLEENDSDSDDGFVIVES